ncbi:MAG: M20 metallopeptidase family protein [Anaerolineales bacterium]
MLEKAQLISDQLVQWRRQIHRHPELGFQEHQTARLVADTCRQLGWRVRENVGKSGVIAELGEGKPCIGLRADMDALPIQEANLVDYASEVAGVMHACGHDAHTAMLLGVATLLAKEKFPGRVRLLFQPAEEVGDEEGISGAPRMIADGAAEELDAVFALHVDSNLSVGKITVNSGYVSAGVDTFYASIIGNGGHGAYPHRTIDPIYISSLVVQALHGIVSRRIHPFAPAVISIGAIHAGEASNVIPDKVDLVGTIRYMQPQIQNTIHLEVENALQIARPLGGDYHLQWEIGYPPMLNHQQAVELIRQVANGMLGAANIGVPGDEMGAEDFGFFTQKCPGAMFYLGAMIEGDVRYGHQSRFDIDERCLPIGSALLSQIALTALENEL